MGLHLTKSILTKMDGQISVISDEGIGSTFAFSFPILREPVNPKNKGSSRSHLNIPKEQKEIHLALHENSQIDTSICRLINTEKESENPKVINSIFINNFHNSHQAYLNLEKFHHLRASVLEY